MLEEEELNSAILVVLANKQDIQGAMSVTEVNYKLKNNDKHLDNINICRVLENHRVKVKNTFKG